MEILDRKDAINRPQDEMILVETAIHRVSCLNRTVLRDRRQKIEIEEENNNS
ncbi:MAG: hypothetical protein V7K72_14045 [Nostoc sp.]|uniref:hypothetical protein n=1 Tax=Nostoc sp. TaxID=1180 RepID=UPI002FF87B29